MTTINQKEYLKKYLGIGKVPGEKKKKKKKERIIGNKLKIIDDDADALIMQEIQEDISAANEDAPQIVAVIDERPPSLRIDERTKSNLWTPIGETSTNTDNQSLKLSNKFKLSIQSKSSGKIQSSPKIKSKCEGSPKRRNSDYDMSPPRRKHVDVTFSPRESKAQELPEKREYKEVNIHSVKNKHEIQDQSPPRKKNRMEEIDNHPIATSPKSINTHDSSPRRRSNISKDCDISPLEIRIPINERDNSPPRKNRQTDSKQKKSRWGKWNPETFEKQESSNERMRKTLDGKKAGLQNAKDLVKEITLLRCKEDEVFKQMSADVSGINAATATRRKMRDIEEEAKQKDKEKKTKEKYDRWGKGLKQVVDQNEKIAEQLHEMSKPLARYADDEDLEKYLKEQEREGDPMLAYIRKKKKKESIAAGTLEKPIYMGEFMPNRFGIHPGYRWDGVDRSNGYEKKWFKTQNSKQAAQEEAFKWSTEDM